jgi:hypothetical protein
MEKRDNLGDLVVDGGKYNMNIMLHIGHPFGYIRMIYTMFRRLNPFPSSIARREKDIIALGPTM